MSETNGKHPAGRPVVVRDRRSEAGAKPAQVSTADAAEAGGDAKLDLANGAVRRSANGGRSMADYFSPENARREVKRSELLGFMEMLEYHRRESTWWRRLWAWLNRHPRPANLPASMATAFEHRTVKPTIKAVETSLESRPARPEDGR